MFLALALLLQQQVPLLAQTRPEAIGAENQSAPLLLDANGAAMKSFTGIHLGNKHPLRPLWTDLELSRIDPARGGTWPSMIVVMSDQLYTIERDSANNCQILGATVRLRDAIRPDGPDVYQYVQRAVQAGSKLVIRIHPSPGDKKTIPPDATTCERKSEIHRTPEDVADEILAIHALNVAEGLPEFGFEPANEPNAEWYPPGTAPEINQTAAWREMDSYFLYRLGAGDPSRWTQYRSLHPTDVSEHICRRDRLEL